MFILPQMSATDLAKTIGEQGSFVAEWDEGGCPEREAVTGLFKTIIKTVEYDHQDVEAIEVQRQFVCFTFIGPFAIKCIGGASGVFHFKCEAGFFKKREKVEVKETVEVEEKEICSLPFQAW